jgi:hypothetical protein
MPTEPLKPNDPPNPPDVVVENVLGAQVGNPPILPMPESTETEEVVLEELPPGTEPEQP